MLSSEAINARDVLIGIFAKWPGKKSPACDPNFLGWQDFLFEKRNDYPVLDDLVFYESMGGHRCPGLMEARSFLSTAGVAYFDHQMPGSPYIFHPLLVRDSYLRQDPQKSIMGKFIEQDLKKLAAEFYNKFGLSL
jgi:hypothetical protein